MTAFQSMTSTVNLEGLEDPMEVYAGGDDDPAEENGIDIDLDLTTDNNENIYDEEMIEDLDPDAEDTHFGVSLVQDEEMKDDEAEDDGPAHQSAEAVYSEKHPDLDDFEEPDISDQIDVAVDTDEGAAQVSESNTNALPSESRLQVLQEQDYPVEHPHLFSADGADISPDDVQWDMDGNPVHEVLTAQYFPTNSPAMSSGRALTHVHEPHTTVDHINHGTHDAQDPAAGASSRSETPLVSKEEQQMASSSSVPETVRPVVETTEETEHHPETTARTIMEHGRHHSKSPSDRDSLQDETPKLSATNWDKASISNIQDSSVLSNTDVFQVCEEKPIETTVAETNPFDEEHAVQEISHVHPVTVKYQDREMYLFPPTEEQKDHDKYLLSDEGLAAEGLQSLFQGFRDYLGESISDMEELEIKFDDLDIWISESNIETANITLAQILDIYRALHCNERDDLPDSMHLTLLTNTRFADNLKHLAKLATEGVGLSQIAYEGHLSADERLVENSQTLDGIGAPESPREIANSAGANVPTSGTSDNQPKPPTEPGLTNSSATESTDAKCFPSDGEGEVFENELPPPEGSDPESAVIMTPTLTETVAGLDTSYTANSSILHNIESSMNSSMQQISDATNEIGEEEDYYENEEGSDVEENARPNEEESAGSSTVQGDDAELLKDDELPNDASLLDDPVANTQQQVPSHLNRKLEAEDVISYETDEEDYAEDLKDAENVEDTENFEYADDVEDAEDDLQWQENDGPDVASSDLKERQPHDTNDTSLYTPVFDEREAFDASDDLDTSDQGKGKDDDRLLNDQNKPTNEQGNFEQATRKPDIIVDDAQSSSLDQSAILRQSPAQMIVHSAEDDDEITFDEEVDEEPKDLSGASTAPATQPPARFSPTVLKRNRQDDEAADMDHGQGKRRRNLPLEIVHT